MALLHSPVASSHSWGEPAMGAAALSRKCRSFGDLQLAVDYPSAQDENGCADPSPLLRRHLSSVEDLIRMARVAEAAAAEADRAVPALLADLAPPHLAKIDERYATPFASAAVARGGSGGPATGSGRSSPSPSDRGGWAPGGRASLEVAASAMLSDFYRSASTDPGATSTVAAAQPRSLPASPPGRPAGVPALALDEPPSVLGLSGPNALEGGWGHSPRPSLDGPSPRPSFDGGGAGAGGGGMSRSSTDASLVSLRRGSFDLGGPLDGTAAAELFHRLHHARQTVDFVRARLAAYSPLSRVRMGVWEALDALDSQREYEAALLGGGDGAAAGGTSAGVDEAAAGGPLDPSMSLREHALQTAELCRLAFPGRDWMALVGLLHGLGKLLAGPLLGPEPQWAVSGESFPVGCRHHPAVGHAQYFSANPDRRRRAYATPTGIYAPGCGLQAVLMSWGAPEYLYLVLALNRTLLPAEALFVVRHQKSACLVAGLERGAGGAGGGGGGAPEEQPYGELLSEADRAALPLLARFRELAAYRRRDVPGALAGDELRTYYDSLMAKYIPQVALRW